MKKRIKINLILSVLLSTLCVQSYAADFSINPTKVDLSNKKTVDTITLNNTEDREVSFEVMLNKWTQDESGKWIEEPSKDLVVYPGLLKLPTKGKGIVRVGVKDKSLFNQELEGSYRLSIQELPGGPAPDGTAVRLLTKVSLPVFLAPQKSTTELSLSTKGNKEELELIIKNEGTVHTSPQEVKIEYLDNNGKSLGEATKLPSSSDYILPQKSSHLFVKWNKNCTQAKEVKVYLEDKTLVSPINGSCK